MLLATAHHSERSIISETQRKCWKPVSEEIKLSIKIIWLNQSFQNIPEKYMYKCRTEFFLVWVLLKGWQHESRRIWLNLDSRSNQWLWVRRNNLRGDCSEGEGLQLHHSPNCSCGTVVEPVCGRRGAIVYTYMNECVLHCAPHQEGRMFWELLLLTRWLKLFLQR